MPQPAPADPADAAPPAQPLSPYDRMGGAPTMRAIADAFYDLMASDPAYAELRAMHGDDLGPIKASLAAFLSGWSGGPRDWFAANRGRCMMSIHAPLPIDPVTASQWAEAMARTIAALRLPDPALGRTMAGLLGDMALSMGRSAEMVAEMAAKPAVAPSGP